MDGFYYAQNYFHFKASWSKQSACSLPVWGLDSCLRVKYGAFSVWESRCWLAGLLLMTWFLWKGSLTCSASAKCAMFEDPWPCFIWVCAVRVCAVRNSRLLVHANSWTHQPVCGCRCVYEFVCVYVSVKSFWKSVSLVSPRRPYTHMCAINIPNPPEQPVWSPAARKSFGLSTVQDICLLCQNTVSSMPDTPLRAAEDNNMVDWNFYRDITS